MCFTTSQEGECWGSWTEAKQICLENNSRLPTIEELKDAAKYCGGIIGQTKDVYTKNMHNMTYYFCYKRNGFKQNHDYWSITEKDNEILSFYFDAAKITKNVQRQTNAIRCIKK